MFREITVYKCDIVPFTPVFCIPFPARWTLAITFIELLVTANNITSFFLPLSVKRFLVCRNLGKFYTAISSVIDLSNKFVDGKCFVDGWCQMNPLRLNYFIRLRKVHSNNRWHKFYGSIRKFFGSYTWPTIWPGFTFRKMTFLVVPPTSTIGTLPWCPSL